MAGRDTPVWVNRLERYLGWIEIPHLAIIIVTLQAMGFLMVASDPVWLGRLALIPELAMAGEYWRFVTFLSLPLASNPIWVFFALWFLYFIINSLEQEWGAFATTLYVLLSMVVVIAFSLAFSYPVLDISHFESTLFLAAAMLFPEFEVRLFFAIPVKMKWLAWFGAIMLGSKLLFGDWTSRLYLFAIYSNFLLFFGPAFLSRLRQRQRRNRFRRGMGS